MYYVFKTKKHSGHSRRRRYRRLHGQLSPRRLGEKEAAKDASAAGKRDGPKGMVLVLDVFCCSFFFLCWRCLLVFKKSKVLAKCPKLSCPIKNPCEELSWEKSVFFTRKSMQDNIQSGTQQTCWVAPVKCLFVYRYYRFLKRNYTKQKHLAGVVSSPMFSKCNRGSVQKPAQEASAMKHIEHICPWVNKGCLKHPIGKRKQEQNCGPQGP